MARTKYTPNKLAISSVNFVELSTGETKPFGVKATRINAREGGEFSAIIGALPNPDIVLKKANRGSDYYRELLYDAQVSACVDSRKAGVLALEWEFNRGGVQDEITNFVKKCFDKIPLYDVISQILDASFFGYSVFENYFIPQDGQIKLIAVVGKPMEWFNFGKENQLQFISKDNLSGEAVDARKFTVATHKATYVNPYGEAVLAKCFWPVTFKKNGLKFWIRFAEKYGMPYLYGQLPLSMQGDEDAADALLAALDDIMQDSVGVLPANTKVELLEAGKSSSVDLYERLVKYLDAQISKAILLHSSGVDAVAGKLGNDDAHLRVRADVVQSDRRIVEEAINSIIETLVELNFGSNVPVPKFEMYEIADVDINIANRDAVLAEKLGVKFAKGYVEKQYNLRPNDFEISDVTPTPTTLPHTESGDFADPSDGTRADQNIIDSGVEGVAGGNVTRAAVDELMLPIVELINSPDADFKVVKAKIVELYGEMDSAKLQTTFESALFAADAIGRLAVKIKTRAA